MSARRFRLEVARNAQRDIADIRVYSRETWGSQEADEYLGRLSRCFESLQANPYLGSSRDDLRPGLRQLVVSQHRVLYRLADDAGWILRVVHARMDLTKVRMQ